MRDSHDTRRSPRISCDLPIEYQIPGTHPRNGRITKLGTASQGRAGVEFAHLGLQQRDEIWRFHARQSAQQRLARS
jgi:hypothetical protein